MFHSKNPEIIRYAEMLHRSPSALSMKLCNIASLDPEIIFSGRSGLKGASKTDRAMWNEMIDDWENFANESEKAVSQLEELFLDNQPKNLNIENENYEGREQTVLSKQRIGQNFFRKAVLSSYNFKCCITGVSNPHFLIASHIVPWKSNPTIRLNPKNGLSLSVLHDKAFDTGFLTISDEYTVLVSKAITKSSDPFLSDTLLRYNKKPIVLPEKFFPDKSFLKFHRENIFETRT
ncbi:MAG: HNH endonuclease [Planctomycetaceae bacterium]|nr:HNH endonuclease [Planctomycetaceae bacterium]